MNKNTITVILIVVLFAVVTFIVFSQPATTDGKINTKVTMISDVILKNGENVEFEITDANGYAVTDQNVTILYDNGSGDIETYSIITDSEGRGYLTLIGEEPGNYNYTIIFNGTDKYNGCRLIDYIEIDSGYVEPTNSTDAKSTASTALYNHINSTSG